MTYALINSAEPPTACGESPNQWPKGIIQITSIANMCLFPCKQDYTLDEFNKIVPLFMVRVPTALTVHYEQAWVRLTDKINELPMFSFSSLALCSLCIPPFGRGPA